MRPLLNCWIVAAWLWLHSRGKSVFWFKRSQRLRGLVPHTGVLQQIKGRCFAIIQYVPPKDKLWTRENVLVLFRGKYRLTVCRAQYTRTFYSMHQLRAYIAALRSCRNPLT